MRKLSHRFDINRTRKELDTNIILKIKFISAK